MVLFAHRRTRLSRRSLSGCLACCLAVCASAAAFGQTSDEPEAPIEEKTAVPLAVINFAGIDRLLQDADYIFALADRPEISDLLRGFMANIDDFKGMRRDKPFGLFVFTAEGLLPTPIPVGYIPVDNIDDLLQTIHIGPFEAQKVTGEEDRYHIYAPGQTLEARIVHGYAFVANNEAALDRKFPDPAQVTSVLSGRYDVCARADLSTINESVKTIFLSALRVSAEGEMQRRDDEPVGQHRIRKANAMRNLEIIEMVMNEGEQLTLGLDVAKDVKQAVLEFDVTARANSRFAEHLKNIGGRQSFFTNVLGDRSALTVSTSWGLDKADRELLTEVLNEIESGMSRELAPTEVGAATPGADSAATPEVTPFTDFFEVFRDTVTAGHADFFLQCLGEPPEKLVIIGGLRLTDGGRMAGALSNIMGLLQGRDGVAELEMNVDSHAGVNFHRVRSDDVDEERDQRFGVSPSLYVGGSSKALWFAVGGETALPTLKNSMDKVAQPAAFGVARDPDAPFQMTFNLAQWVDIMDTGEGGRGVEVVRQALEGDFREKDVLRINFRPTDAGLRLRVEWEEGFLRLLGIAVGRQIDRDQRL